MKPTQLIFFGSSAFAKPTLEWLTKDPQYKVCAIITSPGDEESEISKIALESKAPLISPASLKHDSVLVDDIKNYDPTLGIVVSYGKIIPKDIIELFPMGIINIHPSLLPKYRGPSPIQYAIKNRDSVTGVTIMKIDEQMDHGPILAQATHNIHDEYYIDLRDELAIKGKELLKEVLPAYLENQLIPIAQPETGISVTKLITTNDAEISPQDSIESAEAKVRAFNPNPGAFIYIKTKRIRILRASTKPSILSPADISPGELFVHEKNLYLSLSNGSLSLEEVQKEGSKPMKGNVFADGHQHLIRK